MSDLTREALVAEAEKWQQYAVDNNCASVGVPVAVLSGLLSLLASEGEKVNGLETKLHEIRNEWESALSREMSTFAELKERRAQVDALEGTLHMAVDRLGGLVEGRPTARLNFLQRIDELREIEADRDRLTAEVERLKEAALDHDCPSFGVCPQHTDKLGVDLESCLYCEVMRANAVARLACQNAEKAEAEVTRLRAEVARANTEAADFGAAMHQSHKEAMNELECRVANQDAVRRWASRWEALRKSVAGAPTAIALPVLKRMDELEAQR